MSESKEKSTKEVVLYRCFDLLLTLKIKDSVMPLEAKPSIVARNC
jgi:hypothetical protein